MKNMYLYLIVSSLGSPQQKAARNNFNERPFPQFTYTGINGVVLRVTAKNLLDCGLQHAAMTAQPTTTSKTSGSRLTPSRDDGGAAQRENVTP